MWPRWSHWPPPLRRGLSPTAKAAKKSKAPVIKKVSPIDVAVGETLTIRGKNFIRGALQEHRGVQARRRAGRVRQGRRRHQEDARHQGARVAAGVLRAQRRQPRSDALPHPHPGRKFGKKLHQDKLSPVVSAPRPPKAKTPTESLPDGDCDGDGDKNKNDGDDDNDGLTDGVELSLSLDPCVADTDKDGLLDKWEFDCDRDGALNRDETDDDNDLLSDSLETSIGTDPCAADTDGDRVVDGYEYQSAKDLNDDEHQQPNELLPYPGKRPYPNALFADGELDYDGDSLTLLEEHDLWVYTYA